MFQACSFLLATSDCMSYNLLYDACISMLMVGSKVDKTKAKLTLLVSFYCIFVPLTLWVRTPFWLGLLDTTLCDKVCQWLAAVWFSLGTPVSSTNKTDHNDITEILLKVAFNTITIYFRLFLKIRHVTILHGQFQNQLMTCILTFRHKIITQEATSILNFKYAEL